jgi:hypothetical protein
VIQRLSMAMAVAATVSVASSSAEALRSRPSRLPPSKQLLQLRLSSPWLSSRCLPQHRPRSRSRSSSRGIRGCRLPAPRGRCPTPPAHLRRPLPPPSTDREAPSGPPRPRPRPVRLQKRPYRRQRATPLPPRRLPSSPPPGRPLLARTVTTTPAPADAPSSQRLPRSCLPSAHRGAAPVTYAQPRCRRRRFVVTRRRSSSRPHPHLFDAGPDTCPNPPPTRRRRPSTPGS